MLNPGSIVGDPSRRYQILRAVGRGGMGEVYEATQVSLGRRVALKTIREDLAGRPDLLARFRREAESAAALGHPNLVQVTDFQANAGEPAFLVMEMLEGSTLKDLLEQSGRLEPARVAFIALQALSGLAAAHRAGIIHRDVKPGNLFLQSTSAMRDIVKVLDFGVAKLVLESAPAGAPVMTHFGEVLGTLSYMAPEQGVPGGTIDGRTDIYAVGATLFHALAGVRPFDATEPGGARAPLESIAPWLNRDLTAVVERALERSPDARWPSADAMAIALQPFVSTPVSSPTTGAAKTDPGRVSRGWDPSAIGRLEAPTGGSAFGSPSRAPTAAGSGRDVSALGSPTAFGNAPTAYANGGADASYGPRMVSGAVPAGAVPYALPSPLQASSPSAPPMPMMMPAPMQGWQQPAYGPPPVAPSRFQAPPRRTGPPWWIFAVVGLVLCGAVPIVLTFLSVRRATDPSAIATNVDREVIKQPRPPCPSPDKCTASREENGLTYSLCTRKLPQFSPYKPGEMVLAGAEPHIGLVTTELSDHTYAIRFLTQQTEKQIADEDIAGRLCTPGVRRSGGGQTLTP